MYAKDKTLWEKIKDVLHRMLSRISKAYKNADPESREGRETLRLSRDKLQKAYDLWTQGVLAASENMRNAKIGNPTTEGGELSSTGIRFDKRLSDYPYSMQTVINDYLVSNDQDLIDFIIDARNETWKKRLEYMRHTFINNLPDEILLKAHKLLGFPIDSFKIEMHGEAVHHIDRRHGTNGQHDQSMSDNNDFARMQYVTMIFTRFSKGFQNAFIPTKNSTE